MRPRRAGRASRGPLNADVRRPKRIPLPTRYKFDKSSFRPLAIGRGSCIASDHITVDGYPVGYMYREAADNDHDSGWRFFSGLETQEYADNAENFAMYDINTIANYDPAIILYLDQEIGSAWGRDESGQFIRESSPRDPDA